jgi:hypothetical protein
MSFSGGVVGKISVPACDTAMTNDAGKVMPVVGFILLLTGS